MSLRNPFKSEYVPANPAQNKRRFTIWHILTLVLIIIALAIGLGVGLTRNKSSSPSESSPTNTTTPNIPTPNNTIPANATWWKPQNGTTWQIILNGKLNITTFDPVEVYDIDLFDNTVNMIASLHAAGKKVICYFSAGSYENWRPDANQFPTSALGNPLQGWNGENWLDTNSAAVRTIMENRMDLAVNKSCDAVDPDNIDAYDNDNGLSLTQTDAVNYVTFLAGEAHKRGLGCSLKNGGKILNRVVNVTDFQVNEQCVQYSECATFRPFINQGKPVFHIEYPDPLDAASIKSSCSDVQEEGFSTLIKHMDLDEYYVACNASNTQYTSES
jgi:hypothetical protein